MYGCNTVNLIVFGSLDSTFIGIHDWIFFEHFNIVFFPKALAIAFVVEEDPIRSVKSAFNLKIDQRNLLITFSQVLFSKRMFRFYMFI